MPVTPGTLKRIRKLHDAGNHDRCSARTCEHAAAKIEALAQDDREQEQARRDQALINELVSQGIDPGLLACHDEIAIRLDAMHARPTWLERLQARTEIKLGCHPEIADSDQDH